MTTECESASFDMRKLSFRSVQQHFASFDGIGYDPKTGDLVYAASIIGNFRFESPRHFFKVADYSHLRGAV